MACDGVCQIEGGWLGICFFFSSRRRHTRWPRDWSSDVCSSDLVEDGGRAAVQRVVVARRDVADIAHVRRQREVPPPRATEQELLSGETRGRAEEELVN